MFVKKHYINLVALFLLGLISSLFLMKYAARVTVMPAVFSGVFFLLFVFFASTLAKINFKNNNLFSPKIITTLFVIAVVVMILGYNYISAETRVGRYIAIKSWLDNFRYGFYPYDSKANPSGFPFLFFLGSPFYLLGDVGYFNIFGFALLGILVHKFSKTQKELFVCSLLLFVMPPVYYEYLVRSELLTNMTLFIALCYIAFKYVDSEKADVKFYSVSVLFGLLLSTRLIVFAVFFLFLLFFFRSNIVKGFLFGAVSVAVFVLSLIPFIVWNPEYFVTKGPFSIQFLYLPVWVIVVAPFVLLYIGWMLRDVRELMFASGVMIFILVTISLLMRVMQDGFYNCIVGSYYDISYYCMCIPFLLLSLHEYDVDYHLGKRLTD